jgi:general secretion pathway protein G
MVKLVRRLFNTMERGRSVAAAFTLTEMMVVLIIIGLIAAIVGPRLFNRLDTAKQRTAHVQIENLVSAVNLFRVDTGRLPTNDEGLDVLVHPPADSAQWLGPYLAKDHVPVDPWGHPYVYQTDAAGGRFTVLSYGAYGRAGGTGQDKPLTSEDGDDRGQTNPGHALNSDGANPTNEVGDGTVPGSSQDNAAQADSN